MKNTTNCLVRESECSLQAGQTKCEKCGLNTEVRYVTQDDMDMAVAKGTALYWQNHAQALERTIEAQKWAKREQLELEEIECAKTDAAYWQNHAQALERTIEAQEKAKREQLERAEIERAKADSAKTQAQSEKQEAEARRAQERAQREAAEQRAAQEKAQREQLERAEIERAKAESARVQAQKEKQEAEARRDQVLAQAQRGEALIQRDYEKRLRALAEIELVGPMVALPSGQFLMGSSAEDRHANDSERPQRTVNISYRLAMGKFPVTFSQWDAYAVKNMLNLPKDDGWGRGQRPVINVTWDDAIAYIAWINKCLGLSLDDPCRFRLPTEAEWEYACRAGTSTRYWWGDEWQLNRANGSDHSFSVELVRILSKNPNHRTLPVDHYGEAGCNPWGLCDMHGNVWEMTQDFYREHYVGAPCDGRAVGSDRNSKLRVFRGGGWANSPAGLRSASRSCDPQGGLWNGNRVGFRLARTLP